MNHDSIFYIQILAWTAALANCVLFIFNSMLLKHIRKLRELARENLDKSETLLKQFDVDSLRFFLEHWQNKKEDGQERDFH